MPFMVGPDPVRATLKYLTSGQIVFRDIVQIFSINYNTAMEHHKGAKGFVYWFLPQVQYQNPEVQCITFKNLTPSPFIRVFLGTGKQILIDVDSRSKEEIRDHIKNFTAICKTVEELKFEGIAREKKDNPANFGHRCERHCICEIPGQVPCPNIVPLPFHMRGKYKNNQL